MRWRLFKRCREIKAERETQTDQDTNLHTYQTCQIKEKDELLELCIIEPVWLAPLKLCFGNCAILCMLKWVTNEHLPCFHFLVFSSIDNLPAPSWRIPLSTYTKCLYSEHSFSLEFSDSVVICLLFTNTPELTVSPFHYTAVGQMVACTRAENRLQLKNWKNRYTTTPPSPTWLHSNSCLY